MLYYGRKRPRTAGERTNSDQIPDHPGTPSRSTTKVKTTKTTWAPPEGSGIYFSHRPARPKPFLLRWDHPTEGEKSKAYKTADLRELAARAMVEKQAKHGDAVRDFDPALWLKYREFQKIVGAEVDPVFVAHEWRALKQGTPRAAGLMVAEAVPKYLALRQEEESWGDDAERHASKQLERFTARFGTRRLHDVSREEVREWLFGKLGGEGKRFGVLCNEKGDVLGSHTIKDHLKNVRTFFDYCLREKWGAVENPCEWIAVKTEDGDPVVIGLREAFNFFKANRDERLIGRVALEAFGAVRYGTAGKIEKAALNFERCGIRMAWRIHKTGQTDQRTRYRQGQPENLWAWLEHAPESCWAMTPLNYREAKRNAAIRAGIRPLEIETDADREKLEGLRNIWRHSFISYHLARFKCLPLTQYLAQHSDSKTTEGYEGMADEIDAARFFMLTPETVALSWDEFMALPVESAAPVNTAALAAVLRVA